MNRNLILDFLLALLFIIGLILAFGVSEAHSSTPINRCDEQGGIWQTYPTPHCADKPMTDEQIQYAQRYTMLKQIETREVKNAILNR